MRPGWRPRLSLRATLLLVVAGAVVLPTALLWTADRRLTREAFEPLVAQRRQAVLLMTASALTEPLWTIDERLVQVASARALTEPGVRRLQLTERRPGSQTLDLRQTGPVSEPAAEVRLATTVEREGLPLGDLVMWFDAGEVDRLLAERQRTTLLLVGLQMLAMMGLLVPMLLRRLVRPIQRLKQQASDIAARRTGAQPAWAGHDELGQLGQHLNQVDGQIAGLIQRLESQKAELEAMALHDALTGLPNRRLFGDLLRAATKAAQRDGHRLALLFIDLDKFKAVNDALGHAAGDQLLQEIGRRLRGTVRAGDEVCRHSGDEFLVLMRHVGDWDEVAALADRLLHAAEQPVDCGGQRAAVAVSIGIALYPDDTTEADQLVSLADSAMYAAKQLGGARHSFFRADFNARLQATLRQGRELGRAIEAGELCLHYQPLVAAADGRLIGTEALVRWQHPERGLVPPGEFIPVAEQCGLIGALGAWVIDQACAQIAAWRAAGVAFGSVAVNVSALEFRHHRLVETLRTALARHGVAPHELEIELTETVLMTDTGTSQRIIEQLHAMGLRLVVDDFGTGYSSLAYLKRLRPSKIKIDRSFIRDLPDDADDREVVAAIVQLARALGITVVAEGVETEAQRALLGRLGCDALQGYLTGRPAPPDKLLLAAPARPQAGPELGALVDPEI